MALSRNEQDSQRLKSVPLFDNLHLENSFDDNWVAGQHVLDLLALEDDVFQRCLSAQLAPTALQRSNRGKCAHLLRDLDATADLPLHCPLFALQLQNLTHRWLSESEAPTLTRVKSILWRQWLKFALSCTPPGTLTRHHSSFQTLGS